MFSGIIPDTGTIVATQNTSRGRFITIKADPKIVRKVPEGGSVSIDGVCLTALRGRSPFSPEKGERPRTFTFELMDSTLKRTTLGVRRVGDVVNVEPAMLVGQPIGGHFISGHVDGVGSVREVATRWHTRYLVINVPRALHHYFVPQGSIVVNGVSLTVVEVGTLRPSAPETSLVRGRQARGINIIVPERRRVQRAGVEGQPWFSVALTSYTLKRTNLVDLKVGDKVNIEVDLLAKYLEKFLRKTSF